MATLGVLLLATKLERPAYGSFELESLAQAALPIALAAVAQAIVVIAGGIDLSVGSVMALTNVVAAVLMQRYGDAASVPIVGLVLIVGLVVGGLNGALVVSTRVPDIIVTLATSYVWAGAALLVLASPGGRTSAWLQELANGSVVVLPKAFLVLSVLVAIVWLPLRRSRLGLSLYGVGSDRLAAFRSGVNVGRTKIASYALCGVLAATGGLALSMTTGIGSPVPGNYTLGGVAAVVLGGVSLAGGRGGLIGPVAASFILALIRADLILVGIDPNFSVVLQGAIMVVVVMVAGLLTLRARLA
ncbi:MAG TPA: ABC transporter permease [Chloroflexota bacterium]|nr:ABC transporter permease [Chloroflexota bacterium]